MPSQNRDNMRWIMWKWGENYMQNVGGVAKRSLYFMTNFFYYVIRLQQIYLYYVHAIYFEMNCTFISTC